MSHYAFNLNPDTQTHSSGWKYNIENEEVKHAQLKGETLAGTVFILPSCVSYILSCTNMGREERDGEHDVMLCFLRRAVWTVQKSKGKGMSEDDLKSS